ncbi:hypothetical protein ACFC25_10065 [Pseudarthrobacter sp. NPDC055928]|uniref:hypothetical protein n=1 Tax=Pseudarthrobacter sp. NPDC055928 TaxID=3345661 RepID=UPI0035E0EE64
MSQLPEMRMMLAKQSSTAKTKEQGVSLVGPGVLLNQLTRNVLETAPEAELTEHLGHEHGPDTDRSQHADQVEDRAD